MKMFRVSLSRSRMRVVIVTVCLLVLALLSTAAAQDGPIFVAETLCIEGTIESITPGSVVVRDKDGTAHELLIQDKDAVSLSGGVRLRFPAKVRVTGQYATDSLEKGRQIRFEAMLNRLGSSREPISEIWMGDEGSAPGIKVTKAADKRGGYAKCQVDGSVLRMDKGRLIVRIPRTEFTRKTSLAIKLSDDAVVRMKSDDYRRAGAGAKVVRLIASKLNTGDVLVKELEVDVSSVGTRRSAEDGLAAKYRQLSDDLVKPRDVRSEHFIFITDISDRQAQILLDKLETMVHLLSAYFERGPTGVARGFVVRDLSQWPEGILTEPLGVAKIRSKAGVCFNVRLGKQAQSVIYVCDDHGVVQHEATHAFCHLTFGSTGPTWLAEGVAEMGQYWKANQKAVDISPGVMGYLQQASPKKRLLEIAVPGRVVADDWRDYAWRWALCHLLANNPNYANRFKPLAMALMSGRKGVSFESVYGPVAREISFEYDLFLKAMDNGYRADLCAWQWGKKFKSPGGGRAKSTIKARYGWQACGVRVRAGDSYDVRAKDGKWKIANGGDSYDADGDKQGRGRLVGVVFSDYKLSEEIDLGTRANFKAPATGDLYLRCRDDWNKLEDNDGELTIHLRRTP